MTTKTAEQQSWCHQLYEFLWSIKKKKNNQRIRVLKAEAGKRRWETEKVASFASHFFFCGLRQIILLPRIHNFIFFFYAFQASTSRLPQTAAVIADSCLMFCISKCYYFAQWKLKATLLKLLPDAKSLFLWLLGSLVATEFNSWKKLKRKKISGLEHTEKKNEMAPVYV